MLDKIKNICVALCAAVVWNIFASRFLHALYNTNSEVLLSLFFSCLMAPLVEEALFRHVPFQAVALIKDERIRHKATNLMFILSSLVFGLMHGHGWVSVLYQGFTGAAFAYVYLKNKYSYWSSVALHSIWNIICLFFPF